MKKAIITVFVLLLLCGCKAEPEVIIDDNNVPQAETDTEISLAVTKEGADLIIHTVFPEKQTPDTFCIRSFQFIPV